MQKQCKKLFKTVRAQNTMENPLEYQYFECQLQFWVDFGTLSAPKMGSKIDLGSQNSDSIGAGGSQGAQEQILVDFGIILGSPGSHFRTLWGPSGDHFHIIF